jgi:hypothetical protein
MQTIEATMDYQQKEQQVSRCNIAIYITHFLCFWCVIADVLIRSSLDRFMYHGQLTPIKAD